MNKSVFAASITLFFSTIATANTGLADRINEARSYPEITGSSVTHATSPGGNNPGMMGENMKGMISPDMKKMMTMMSSMSKRELSMMHEAHIQMIRERANARHSDHHSRDQ
ncbi:MULTISPECIES: hypothetical protein [Marinobacter]|uniref:hypothetical protein n=1 Tax=Marinobacter TaxID=2742 RepID=UPI001C939668|nr:hypothetical protein [Marinobacter nauticus]MBY6101823.1 hypothetical protein [Marinobacter nauticus]MBY6195110.1 hypothetical protein [Marinobacter nauticus]MBY6216258.1 hypothetical protein [Marinobacter nauticus]